MRVQTTEDEDGVATMTLTFEPGDDHKFEVWPEGDEARVEFQETQSWRGSVLTTTPDERLFRALAQSDEMTEYLDRHGLDGVRAVQPSGRGQ